jgi:hypothetical protein
MRQNGVLGMGLLSRQVLGIVFLRFSGFRNLHLDKVLNR